MSEISIAYVMVFLAGGGTTAFLLLFLGLAGLLIYAGKTVLGSTLLQWLLALIGK